MVLVCDLHPEGTSTQIWRCVNYAALKKHIRRMGFVSLSCDIWVLGFSDAVLSGAVRSSTKYVSKCLDREGSVNLFSVDVV